MDKKEIDKNAYKVGWEFLKRLYKVLGVAVPTIKSVVLLFYLLFLAVSLLEEVSLFNFIMLLISFHSLVLMNYFNFYFFLILIVKN